MKTRGTVSNLFLVALCITGWVALIGQFYLILENRVASIPETIVRFFGFFTILSNILVTVAATVLLLEKPAGWLRFFSKASTLAAIGVYIFVVGLVYNTVLRFQWKFEGLGALINELLHAVMPVAYIVYWIFFAHKKTLPAKTIGYWLIFPALYLVFVLLRGPVAHFYPYPFMNVDKFGYAQVALNSLGVLLAFIGASVVFIWGGNKLSKKGIAL